jgi:hypothetical protein
LRRAQPRDAPPLPAPMPSLSELPLSEPPLPQPRGAASCPGGLGRGLGPPRSPAKLVAAAAATPAVAADRVSFGDQPLHALCANAGLAHPVVAACFALALRSAPEALFAAGCRGLAPLGVLAATLGPRGAEEVLAATADLLLLAPTPPASPLASTSALRRTAPQHVTGAAATAAPAPVFVSVPLSRAKAGLALAHRFNGSNSGGGSGGFGRASAAEALARGLAVLLAAAAARAGLLQACQQVSSRQCATVRCGHEARGLCSTSTSGG